MTKKLPPVTDKQQEMIDEIMDAFDFEKGLEVMQFLK